MAFVVTVENDETARRAMDARPAARNRRLLFGFPRLPRSAVPIRLGMSQKVALAGMSSDVRNGFEFWQRKKTGLWDEIFFTFTK